VPIVASAPDLHIINPLRRQGRAVRTEALLYTSQHHTLKAVLMLVLTLTLLMTALLMQMLEFMRRQ
jgi:hypothetical protein